MKSSSKSIGLEYNINKGNTESQILDEELDSSLFDQKIELATDGVEPILPKSFKEKTLEKKLHYYCKIYTVQRYLNPN
jgi:hypothetical protein